MKRVEAGPVNHKIDIETIRGWFESNLGCNPYKEIGVADRGNLDAGLGMFFW